jgi:hypothetical protein
MIFMKEKAYYIDGKKLEVELARLNQTFNDNVDQVMKKKKISRKAAEKESKGYISDDLGEMFLAIAYNLANKNNFNNYTYKEEMIGLGVEYLCRFAKKFDKNNPKANGFSYCTQICYNGFIQAITKEKKRSELKDKLIKKAMEKSEQERWLEEERGNLYEDDGDR